MDVKLRKKSPLRSSQTIQAEEVFMASQSLVPRLARLRDSAKALPLPEQIEVLAK
jgi:hypothetical protein